MDPVAKAVLNSLKCPLCGGQVDLLDWRQAGTKLKYNFCCANNYEHYRLFFIHWDGTPRIEYETVVFYEGKYQYRINQFLAGTTEILLSRVDAENRVIDPQKYSMFEFEKHLFKFSQTNREKVVNRVKTIVVFS